MRNEGCKKTSGKYGENKMANNAKKVYPTKHCLIKPDELATHSMFKLKNIYIGTRTVDHWLWIMDQELLAAFGQYIAA